MAFTPRAFEAILNDMIAHVRANTTLTDFTVGSNIRTILEAAALEDDEQYYQMVQLLDDFSFNTATGTDLDKRAADYNFTRLTAAPSTGKVWYVNDALITDSSLYNAVSGSLALFLNDSSDFPTSGYTYVVRIGEGLPVVEDVDVSANDTSLHKLTITALANDHVAGERVSLVSGTAQTVSAGIQVQVAAQGENLPVIFQAKESATVAAGNYYSNLAGIISTESGKDKNVGAGTVSQFSGGAPFAGAGVKNPANTQGGRNRETDREFRDHIRQRIQALSRGTRLSLEGLVKGVTDSRTGQRVVTSKLIESFADAEHKLYIDDGTGMAPSYVTMALTRLDGALVGAEGSFVVDDVSDFPSAGYVLLDPGDVTSEVCRYVSKTVASNTLTLDVATPVVSAHDTDRLVLLVDKLDTAERGQNYFQLAQYPVQRGTIELYDNSAGSSVLALRTLDTDYYLNRTNGQTEYYGAGLPEDTEVYAHYSYYTGLLALVQYVVNGIAASPTIFPGVAAGGVTIYVDTPSIRTVSMVLSISAETGYDEDTLRTSVQRVVENYIDSRAIGENVILAQASARALAVTGVSNVTIKNPLLDIVITESETAKSFDSAGNSLVRVV